MDHSLRPPPLPLPLHLPLTRGSVAERLAQLILVLDRPPLSQRSGAERRLLFLELIDLAMEVLGQED